MKGIAVINPTIKEMAKAKISFNKDEVMTFLEDALFLYGNQVVTDDTVKDAKKTCADLNKLKKNVDSFRKETKKQLIEEVTQFESDVKDILGVIDSTYAPIKKQIDHFTELQRIEKEEIVNGIIDAVRHETGIRDEFFNRFERSESWLNASISANKIRQEVESVMNVLVMEQKQHDIKIDAVAAILSAYNEKLRFKYNILDFERYIDTMEISSLTAMVKEQVEQRLQDEAEELERIEREKQEAIERAEARAKAEAEARARAEAEEKERQYQEELRRAEFEKEKIANQAATDKAVAMQEISDIYDSFIPQEVEAVDEIELLTVKYLITASKEQLDKLESYLQQFGFEYQETF